MAQKKEFKNWKDYYYPGTTVLVNRKNIHSQLVLDSAEKDFVALRMLELIKHPIKGSFDFKHLKNIHHYLFQDIYDWAGEVRRCEMSRDSVREDGSLFAGTCFCFYQNIDAFANDIFGKLEKENYFLDYDNDTKIDKLAQLYGDINAMHAFREGNGRAQREFVETLAEINGLDLDITKIDKEKLRKAAFVSFYSNNELLKMLFSDNIREVDFDTQIEYIKSNCEPFLAERIIKSLYEKKENKHL